MKWLVRALFCLLLIIGTGAETALAMGLRPRWPQATGSNTSVRDAAANCPLVPVLVLIVKISCRFLGGTPADFCVAPVRSRSKVG